MFENFKKLFGGDCQVKQQSQKKRVLAFLCKNKGKIISSNVFVYELGVARISAVIHQLRKEGYQIITLYRPINRSSNVNTCSYSFIDKQTNCDVISLAVNSGAMKVFN